MSREDQFQPRAHRTDAVEKSEGHSRRDPKGVPIREASHFLGASWALPVQSLRFLPRTRRQVSNSNRNRNRNSNSNSRGGSGNSNSNHTCHIMCLKFSSTSYYIIVI